MLSRNQTFTVEVAFPGTVTPGCVVVGAVVVGACVVEGGGEVVDGLVSELPEPQAVATAARLKSPARNSGVLFIILTSMRKVKHKG